jgi:hypothetical protein
VTYIHDSAGGLTAAALAKLEEASWVHYQSGAGSNAYSGLLGAYVDGGFTDQFLLRIFGTSIFTNIGGSGDRSAPIAGMVTGTERWHSALSVGAAGHKACASVTGTPTVAGSSEVKQTDYAGGSMWRSGYTDLNYPGTRWASKLVRQSNTLSDGALQTFLAGFMA